MDEMEKNERELNELETEVEFSEVEPNEVESNEVEAGEQEESKASEPKSLSKQAKIEKKSRFSNLFADRQKVMIFLVMLAIAVLMSGFFFLLGAKSSKRYYDDLKDKYTTENLPSSSETETEEIEETQEETQTQVETEEPSEEDEQAFVIPEREIQWDALRKENVDIYAWIYIPDTKVDYPIVQHPTDDEYYVDHAIDGETDKHGAIFSQATYNDLSCSDFNTILYGHNMLDGSMFKGLHSYLKQDFFDEHPYIFVYMPDRTDVYAVYAQYTFTNELIPYAYDFETDKGREEYLSVVNSYRYKDEHSIFKMEYTPTAKDYLLTLSTCTSPKNSKKRFLVQGVRIHSESSLVPREQ